MTSAQIKSKLDSIKKCSHNCEKCKYLSMHDNGNQKDFCFCWECKKANYGIYADNTKDLYNETLETLQSELEFAEQIEKIKALKAL
jgi:hypothetical protein